MLNLSKLRKPLLLFAGLATAAIGLIAISQVIQLYQWGSVIHPALGYILAGLLAIILLALLTVPWIWILRLPAPLRPPKTEAELPEYLAKLRSRLAKHKLLRAEGFTADRLQSDAGLQEALDLLDEQAKAIMQKTARHTFLVTAISQNGKLDGLTVLFTQVRMVYQISRVYHQRPTITDLFWLYTNVAGSSLLATEVEDLDISSQVEPLVNVFIKNSASKSLPWAGGAAQLVVDSLMEGTINAFFTLRVGVLASQYCASTHPLTRKEVRTTAYKEAAGMLGKVVVQVSGEVVTAILKSLRKAGVDTVVSGAKAVTDTATWVKDTVVNWTRRITGQGKSDALPEGKETPALENFGEEREE